VPNIFVWNQLAFASLVALAVLSGPLMALAYKVRHGNPPIPMETREFWTRAVFAGLGVTALQVAGQVLGAILVNGAELPVVFAYLVLATAYLPLVLWYLFRIFLLEDFLQAIGLLVIFAVLTGLVFVPVVLVLRGLLEPSAG
jgi:hypothetical protein